MGKRKAREASVKSRAVNTWGWEILELPGPWFASKYIV